MGRPRTSSVTTSNSPPGPVSCALTSAAVGTTRLRSLSAYPPLWRRRRQRTLRGQAFDDVVDAVGERRDVGRLYGREHRDAQLVAPELSVRVGVDDAVA